jgi:hypothetical protein
LVEIIRNKRGIEVQIFKLPKMSPECNIMETGDINSQTNCWTGLFKTLIKVEHP